MLSNKGSKLMHHTGVDQCMPSTSSFANNMTEDIGKLWAGHVRLVITLVWISFVTGIYVAFTNEILVLLGLQFDGGHLTVIVTFTPEEGKEDESERYYEEVKSK